MGTSSPIEQGAHAVVPQLDDAVVQRGENPWSNGVERQPLHAIALRLELGEHGECERDNASALA